MRRHEVSDEPWDTIKDLLPGKPGDPGRTGRDHRGFINAVMGIAKTGAPWRDLPERFGEWNSSFQRFNRRSKRGAWERLLRVWQDPDLEALMPDATVVRAHRHAAGARKKGAPIKRLVDRVADSAPRRLCLLKVGAGRWN